MRSLKILPQAKKIDLLIVINLVLIALSLCLINFTNIDVRIQNHLFDFQNNSWLIDKDEPVKKFIFYKFPKILLGITITFCLIASIIGFKTRFKNRAFFSKNRHFLFLVFLGLTLNPLITGNIKKFTNVYCPTQLKIYNGDKPYVKIFGSYAENFHQTKRAQCFPAGHPVTGFSLFIFFFACRKNLSRLLGLTTALTLGWIMSFYQMAKGAHFLGDSLVSMLVCFLIAALIARIHLNFRKYD